MEDKILFKKKLIKVGDSNAVTLPPALIEFLGITNEDVLVMTGDIGKNGKFLALWKEDKEG